jgi:hypothetical protein
MGAVVFSGPGTGPVGDGKDPARAAEPVEVVPATPADPKRQTRADIAAKLKD